MTGLPDTGIAAGARTPCAAPLAVTRLQLTNFRSYTETVLAVDARSVVLAGPNGAGKTNLLDALSLLAPGRGLRGAKLMEHARKGPAQADGALWAVAARVARGEAIHDIGTGILQSAGSRQVRLNGAQAASSAELGDIVQLLWLTPAMDRLFIESASGRRRFLDRLVVNFQPAHARASIRYETAMRERARLLKYGPRDPGWLDGLESEMAEAGAQIAQARAQVVEKLSAALAERGSAGAFPAAALALSDDTHQVGVETLRDQFGAGRIRDAEAGRTLSGPHTTDLLVRHTSKRMEARACSTGEQKALLISIILAEARELARERAGMAPILLLDEIAAHLDATRRAALFAEIAALGAQAWMTGTDLSLFASAQAQIFDVHDGAFTTHANPSHFHVSGISHV